MIDTKEAKILKFDLVCLLQKVQTEDFDSGQSQVWFALQVLQVTRKILATEALISATACASVSRQSPPRLYPALGAGSCSNHNVND